MEKLLFMRNVVRLRSVKRGPWDVVLVRSIYNIEDVIYK